MKKLLATIDGLSIWTGKTASWLILFIVGSVVYEVLMRYVLNLPTRWVSESMVLGCGFIYVLGAAWALQDNRHVKIDFLYDRLSKRGRAILDCLTFPFFVLYLGFFAWAAGKYAWRSVLLRETSGSAWDPPIYPLKVALALGVALLLLQGLAKLLRDLHFAITGRTP